MIQISLAELEKKFGRKSDVCLLAYSFLCDAQNCARSRMDRAKSRYRACLGEPGRPKKLERAQGYGAIQRIIHLRFQARS